MNNDFRDYSDYLMHYGVPGMKWKHHHYVVDQPRQIGQGQAAIQSHFDRGERTAVVRRLQSDNNRDIQAARRSQEVQNNFDRGVRAGQSNQRQREIQSHFDRGAQGTKPMFERSNSQNDHTITRPRSSNRVSREYAAEYTYNTTGRSDNESVGRMHKRLQKNGDANPNANLSTRRSRGLMTTLGVNHGGHHFSGESNQEHDREYDDHHLTGRIVKNVRKRRR